MQPRRKQPRTSAVPAYRHNGNYFVRVYRKVRKGVVYIRSLKDGGEKELPPHFPFFFPREKESNEVMLGIGAGFVVHPSGLIATSEHVVSNPRSIIIKLYNGKKYVGKVAWSDRDHDLALIKIAAPFPLHPLRLGSSGRSKVGEIVMSIGNPLGLENSITSGIISRKHDSVAVSDIELEDIIQTDCAINPGSSGGPLINLKGEVIGMNAFMAKNKNGLGFAIGIDGIKRRIRNYVAGAKP